MSFTSAELNLLILRYLRENGFEQTAHYFEAESSVGCSSSESGGLPSSDVVPQGALVRIVQKGLLYAEVEVAVSTMNAVKIQSSSSSSTSADGEQAGTSGVHLSLVDAVTSNPLERARKRPQISTGASDASGTPAKRPAATGNSTAAAGSSSPRASNLTGPSWRTSALSGLKQQNNTATPTTAASDQNGSAALTLNGKSTASSSSGSSTKENKPVSRLNGHHKRAVATAHNNGTNNTSSNGLSNGGSGGIKPMDVERSRVRYLRGHTSEVFVCAWNPRSDLIASGSGDATARVWNVDSASWWEAEASTPPPTPLVLRHASSDGPPPPPRSATENGESNGSGGNKDVTCLDWHPDGDMLATGCYDGHLRIWKAHGVLIKELQVHEGPVFALKWSANGRFVLSAGVDYKTVLWEPLGKGIVNKWAVHEAAALDVDWVDDMHFASCSTDGVIHLCNLGQKVPVRTLSAHQNEVNAVRFDRVSRRLASCSDDKTVKVWALDRDSPLHDMAAHQKEIYTIRWSPLGHRLASASFDNTVRVWDVERGDCVRTLVRHSEPVYSVGYAPTGRHLASGAFDCSIFVWDMDSGLPVLTYNGRNDKELKSNGGIFEVSWNARGDRIAASSSDGTVIVIDVRNHGSLRL